MTAATLHRTETKDEGSMSDPTMAALLGVHRKEINDLEQQVTQLTNSRDMWQGNHRSEVEAHGRTKNQLRTLEKRATELAQNLSDSAERTTKLENIINSLNLELADARAENARLRDDQGDCQ